LKAAKCDFSDRLKSGALMAGKEETLSAATIQKPIPAETHGAGEARISVADRQAIHEQLQLLFTSRFFHSSHRCQMLLRYLVEETLNGNSDSLKERLIGVVVFQRSADYDTNSDPVVRIAAGELRKRLAQYYYDPTNRLGMRIELPTGSYVPVFRIAGRSPLAVEDSELAHPEGTEEEPDSASAAGAPTEIRPRWTRRWMWWSVAGIAATVAASVLVWEAQPRAPQDAFKLFWAPVITSPNPVLLCMGEMWAPQVDMNPNPFRNPLRIPMRFGSEGNLSKGYPIVILPDVETVAKVINILTASKKAYTIRGESLTTFDDLQKGPVVLVGADNDWTIRMTNSLRFRFAVDDGLRTAWIEDQQNPHVKIGEIEQADAHPSEDYALVARILDGQTSQPTIVVGGLTSAGTNSASEFLTNPHYLNDSLQNAPHGWNEENMELLIKINIVDGDPGPPQIVTSYFWKR
jgi:hypothetical protein